MTWKPHKATRPVSEEELVQLGQYTPRRTRTHIPIPHSKLLERVLDNLSVGGYTVKNLKCFVSKDNQKFMGKMNLWKEEINFVTPEYKHGITVIHSNDKTLPVLLGNNLEVSVCENGCYSGIFPLRLKHTGDFMYNLDKEIRNFTQNIEKEKTESFQNMEKLKEMDFSSNTEVHDFMIRAMKRGIINPTEIKPILKHWEEPEHPEFDPRNGYSLFNAHTSHLRSSNPLTLPQKTIKIRNYIDEFKKAQHVITTPSRSGEFAEETYDLGR